MRIVSVAGNLCFDTCLCLNMNCSNEVLHRKTHQLKDTPCILDDVKSLFD
jgi:hypothetical protein